LVTGKKFDFAEIASRAADPAKSRPQAQFRHGAPPQETSPNQHQLARPAETRAWDA
jgi:hypothetical protein